MKSGTSYWTIPFVLHNLLALGVVVGVQHFLLGKLAENLKAVAVALPHSQAGAGEATAPFLDGFQFNAFDTTRTTFVAPASSPASSSPSSSSSSSSLSSSSPSFQGASELRMSSLPLSYPTSLATSLQPSLSSLAFALTSSAASSPAAYPSAASTTAAGSHSSRASRKMSALHPISSSAHPASPTSSTSALSHLRSTHRSSSTTGGRIPGGHQTGGPFDFFTASTLGLSSSALPVLKTHMKGSHNSHGAANGANSRQQFSPDFIFSKNHWTSSDAALTGGGVGGSALSSMGGTNYRLNSKVPSTSSLASATASETERPRIFRNRHHHEQHWGPFFEEPLNSSTSGDNSVTTAHLYTEAVLNCRVGMLKDKTVMWVRRTEEKVSLLTVGNITYSSDPRIRVKFQYPNNWRLLINPTQWEDAGVYMCQVSTHPPRVFATNLTVIEPPLRLIDEQERDVGDRYYKTGSTIDLQCQVSRSFLYKEKQNILKSLKPLNAPNASSKGASAALTTATTASAGGKASTPHSKHSEGSSSATTGHGFASTANSLFPRPNDTGSDKHSGSLEKQFSNLVFWSKDDEQLPPAALKRLSSNDKWLTSRVTIDEARLSDSGNYSCSIGRLFTAIVQVQVLTGELPAAVQHNSAAAPALHRWSPSRPRGMLGAVMQISWLIYLAAAFLGNCVFFSVIPMAY